MEYFFALNLLQLVVTVIALGAVVVFQRRIMIGRWDAAGILAGWIALATVPYWGLGPFSFSYRLSELDYAFTTYWLEITRPAGAKFLHGFAGGNDAYGLGVASGQYLSLERLLLWALPWWVANAIHKIAVYTAITVGSYLLIRRAGGNRLAALGMAGVAAYGWGTLSYVTWTHGLGPSLAPLLAYLFAYRHGRRFYYSGVAAGSLLFALSSSFPHSLLFVAPPILIAGVLRGWRPLIRGALPGLTVLISAVLLNWHETLYAMASLAPYTHRGAEFAFDQRPLELIVRDWFGRLTPIRESVAVALFALAALAARRSRRFWISSAAFAAVFFGGPLLQQIPFDTLGLGPLRGFQFVYLILSMPTVATLLVAAATSARTEGPFFSLPRPVWFLTILLIALAGGKFVHAKAYEVSQWLVEGNLRMLTGNEDVRNRNWGLDQPFRVVSVPYRFPITFPPLAGLETLDGVLNLIPRSLAFYWQYGINKTDTDSAKGGYLTLFDLRRAEKCCDRYRIDDYANTALLRAANVAFILSRLPLHGRDLTQVAGPPEGTIPPRAATPWPEKVRGYLHLNFNADPVYVYALRAPLPRLYAARAVQIVDDSVDEKKFHQIVAETAPDRTVVVRRSAGRFLAENNITVANVKRFAIEANGLSAELSAPDGGIVVANIPFSPFWKAYVAGKSFPVVPVNGIQMAVEIPAGATRVDFRYERPLLREKISGWLNRLFMAVNYLDP